MKEILHHLFAHQALSRTEAQEILKNIAAGKYNAAQIAAFMTVYLMRNITVEELAGFRDAMLDLCVPVDLAAYQPIDVCGTGGDGKDTFNISTLSAFVLAACGVRVAKHGNHGVSSISGSSTVLEQWGITFSNDISQLRRSIEETNICFMHAPLFHPAMKNVAPIRKELGVKTFFNMLGPMVNPALPPYQLVGVFSLELARLYNYLYQQTNKQFAIVHSLDGYDEISLTGAFKVYGRKHESLYTPEELTLSRLSPEALFGGRTVAESAEMFGKVLRYEGTAAQHEVVIANAALGLRCVRPTRSWAEALAEANEALASGRAWAQFQKFRACVGAV